MEQNCKELREQAAAAAREAKTETLADRIKNRMLTAWGEWQPDYERWVNWSNGLYTADATISAIGDVKQVFRDYQASMKLQRDTCSMEMGPILNMIVENNVVALVYHMYLTPKGKENATTFGMVVTEYNTLEEVEGKLMVTHLDLYTDGGGLSV